MYVQIFKGYNFHRFHGCLEIFIIKSNIRIGSMLYTGEKQNDHQKQKLHKLWTSKICMYSNNIDVMLVFL